MKFLRFSLFGVSAAFTGAVLQVLVAERARDRREITPLAIGMSIATINNVLDKGTRMTGPEYALVLKAHRHLRRVWTEVDPDQRMAAQNAIGFAQVALAAYGTLPFSMK